MKVKEINSISGKTLVQLLESTLAKGASFRFKVKGSSMSPFIKDGDVVTISPLHSLPIGLGKSVAFIHPKSGKLVIHRVVGKNGDYYAIKGDNTTEVGNSIPIKNILGAVTKIERNKRKIFLGLGPERFIIAFLSRRRLLPFIFWCWRLIPFSIRKFIKCKIGL